MSLTPLRLARSGLIIVRCPLELFVTPLYDVEAKWLVVPVGDPVKLNKVGTVRLVSSDGEPVILSERVPLPITHVAYL